jgi:hypothetical protein
VLLPASLAIIPLLAEPLPVTFLSPPSSPVLAWGNKALVLLVMLLAVAARAWADRRTDPWQLPLILVALAALMTAWHWWQIDCVHAQWQRELYLDLLNHQPEEPGQLRVPHQYRLLPYGFTRGLERLTGDFWFSCITYRWFFTYWFVWGAYRFAGLFHAPGRALLTLVPLVLLYPFSVYYYCGQLTDPLSHALFVLGYIYLVQDRWLALAAALFLGVLAKETVVLLVPAYLAYYWRGGLPALAKTIALVIACLVAYFAARLPLGWAPGNRSINGVDELMIASNLGIGGAYDPGSWALLSNYLHPLLFVGTFLPFIAWHWRQIDGRLRVLFVVVAPLLLFSNLCFGWMYESRNYMPLVPLLATMALPARRPPPP